MATSKTQICNMALAHIGHTSRISNVDSATSPEATNCALFFDQCRDTLLEAQRWPFAVRRVTLQDLGTPYDDWDYRYAYPNTCKLALKIVNTYARADQEQNRIPFRIVDQDDGLGRAILTDQQNAVLEFNYAVTDVTLFPHTFVMALSLLLASTIATPLQVDPKITSNVFQQYGAWMNEAAQIALREEQPDVQPDSTLVTGRY
nr:phage protein [bacterium]